MNKKFLDSVSDRDEFNGPSKSGKHNQITYAKPRNKSGNRGVTKEATNSSNTSANLKESRLPLENETLSESDKPTSHSKSETASKSSTGGKVRKIYRSEKVIKELKAVAQLKAEVKVNVTFLNKEVLQNSRSLKERQDKPQPVKIHKQQQSVLPDSTVETERFAASNDENLSLHSSSNDSLGRDQSVSTSSRSSNGNTSHNLNSSSSKSRSFFDSFCPNLFSDSIPVMSKNLPPQKTFIKVRKEHIPCQQTSSAPVAHRQHSERRSNVSVEGDDSGESHNQPVDAARVRVSQSKSIPEIGLKTTSLSKISSTHRHADPVVGGGTSPEVPLSHSPAVKSSSNRTSVSTETDSQRASSAKPVSPLKNAAHLHAKEPKGERAQQTEASSKTEESGPSFNPKGDPEAVRDTSAKQRNDEDGGNKSSICIRGKARNSLKSTKCFRQDTSHGTLRKPFIRRFERHLKRQRILKRKNSLLRFKPANKSFESKARPSFPHNVDDNGLVSTVEVEHPNSRPSSRYDTSDETDEGNDREDKDVFECNKHRDYDSDETDICDYDNQPEEHHFGKSRKHKTENVKVEEEARMEEEEVEEEEKSDSRSELGSDGSYDTTDEDLKTKRLAVLSLLPTKTSQQLNSKAPENPQHNGDDRVSMNTLSLTDSILKLGRKRVNEEALLELEFMKKKQRKSHKTEVVSQNYQEKEKRWLRHRRRHYYDSEWSELKTCKRLSLLEAKSKGLLNPDGKSAEAEAGSSCPDGNEMESSDSNKSAHNRGDSSSQGEPSMREKQEKQKKTMKQKGRKGHPSPADHNEDSSTKGEQSPAEERMQTEVKDVSGCERDSECLVVDESPKEGADEGGARAGPESSATLKLTKKIKKQGKQEKATGQNGTEPKPEKKEPGKVGRKRKKVSEESLAEPLSDRNESVPESFVLSRELGPKFNWLENKIQQNYKNDPSSHSGDGEVTPKSQPTVEPLSIPVGAAVSEVQTHRKSKNHEVDSQKPEKRAKSSPTDHLEKLSTEDETLPSGKHALARNFPKLPQQTDVVGVLKKDLPPAKSSKKEGISENVQTFVDKGDVSNGGYTMEPPVSTPLSSATTTRPPEPCNLIDLTTDNPTDHMSVRHVFPKNVPGERVINPYLHTYMNDSSFGQSDTRKLAGVEVQPRFRTLSPSFEFSDPIMLQEYRQKFDNYIKIKQITDSKQREIMKLEVEKERLKRDMIIWLNKMASSQPNYGTPRIGKSNPIPIPSPPSVHATKLLSKSGLSSPPLPPHFLSMGGINSFHGDEMSSNVASSIVQKLGGRRFFPPDLQVPHDRLPRENRAIDHLPQQQQQPPQSSRVEDSDLSHTEAEYGPIGLSSRKPMGAVSEGIGHDLPLVPGHAEQFYNSIHPNDLKMAPARYPEVTYSLKDMAPAKPLTTQTLNMCFSVHKELLEQAKKLTPNYKSPQILLQTLPASDKLHLSGRHSRPPSPPLLPPPGRISAKTPSTASPDVIITNASTRTPKLLQQTKQLESAKDMEPNFEKPRQEYFVYTQHHQAPRSSPPIKISKPPSTEPKGVSAQESIDKTKDTEIDSGRAGEKAVLDLSMKTSQYQLKDQLRDVESAVASRASETLEACPDSQVLDLSTPLNLKVKSNRDEEAGVGKNQIEAENRSLVATLSGSHLYEMSHGDVTSEKISPPSKQPSSSFSSASSSSSVPREFHEPLQSSEDQSEIRDLAPASDANVEASSNFPEWMERRKKKDMEVESNASVQIESRDDRDSKSIDAADDDNNDDEEEEKEEADNKSNTGSNSGDAPLTIVDDFEQPAEEQTVARDLSENDKGAQEETQEADTPPSQTDKKEEEEEEEEEKEEEEKEEPKRHVIDTTEGANKTILRLLNKRPNSCGDLLPHKTEDRVTPELRSQSANIPLVPLRLVKGKDTKESSPDVKHLVASTGDNDYQDLTIKKAFNSTAGGISSSTASELLASSPRSNLKESYLEAGETLLNLSLKTTPAVAPLPLPSRHSSVPLPQPAPSRDDQVLASPTVNHDPKPPGRIGTIDNSNNDDEITSKNSMMMMMMMMMSHTTNSIDGKPELLNLDSEKFNAHLDETIKKELQSAEKEDDNIPESVDLSSTLTTKSLEDRSCSSTTKSSTPHLEKLEKEAKKVTNAPDEAALHYVAPAAKPPSSPSHHLMPWQEHGPSYPPSRHSVQQKEHSAFGSDKPDHSPYYRFHPALSQALQQPPPLQQGVPPQLAQPSPTQHSILQRHHQQQQQQQAYQQSKHQKMLLQQQQQQKHQQQQQILLHQQLELQRPMRSSSPVLRTRHPTPPTAPGYKHSKPYSRVDIEHMNMSDIKSGGALNNGVEKFVLVDSATRKPIQSEASSKRQYSSDSAPDGSQLPYYSNLQQQQQQHHVRPQNLQHYQQVPQSHYGVQPPIRPYSPPVRPTNPLRLHDLHLQQLEMRKLHQQKGLKYPIPLPPHSSQLVHQVSSNSGMDSHDPQGFVKPHIQLPQTSAYQHSPPRFKNQSANFPADARAYPLLGGVSGKESLSPTGFTPVAPKALRRQESADSQQHFSKHPLLSKHPIDAPKPPAHDPLLLKPYPMETDNYRYHLKQPRHLDATSRFDPALLQRQPGYSKVLGEAPASRYEHGFRSAMVSEMDLRGISLRGPAVSSPHMPLGASGGTMVSREIVPSLPSRLTDSYEPYCFNCFKPAHFICSTCKKVSYCCKECQAESWEKGHKDECR